MIDRMIDPCISKFHLQHRRRGCQAVAHDRGRHADRAEIIGMAVSWVMPGRTAIGAGNGCNQHAGPLGHLPGEAVNVTEGERQVNDERGKRKP